MTKIQKVVREIEDLRDFYKKTKSLRDNIKKSETERLKIKQLGELGSKDTIPKEN
ncbi:MAG: hypothetical protein GY749_26360 [Desulfobacteraceae bacterium]|nr:hypothetical protein [Desulfobacteraceae bacterium]